MKFDCVLHFREYQCGGVYYVGPALRDCVRDDGGHVLRDCEGDDYGCALHCEVDDGCCVPRDCALRDCVLRDCGVDDGDVPCLRHHVDGEVDMVADRGLDNCGLDGDGLHGRRGVDTDSSLPYRVLVDNSDGGVRPCLPYDLLCDLYPPYVPLRARALALAEESMVPDKDQVVDTGTVGMGTMAVEVAVVVVVVGVVDT